MTHRLFFPALLLLALSAGQAHALSRTEFEGRANAMMSNPASAHQLLDLCETAKTHTSDSAYLASAHGYASHALWLVGRYAQSEKEAQQALALDPNAFPAYFFLADALNAQGKYEDAYRVCLIGVAQRGGDQKAAGRKRCREEFLDRVALSPATVLYEADHGRMPSGKEVLVRGRVAAIDADTIIFSAGGGQVVCLLEKPRKGSRLHPMTKSEENKHSRPSSGLEINQVITIVGRTATAHSDQVQLESCIVVP